MERHRDDFESKYIKSFELSLDWFICVLDLFVSAFGTINRLRLICFCYYLYWQMALELTDVYRTIFYGLTDVFETFL